MTNITFNLDNNLISFIKSYASKNSITQKEAVESALKRLKREEMIKSIRQESQELWQENKEEFLFLANS
jgi:archaellum biogenesis protein FlaJ (TadC family)